MFKVNIEAIEKAGLRDDVIIMVGGAPVTQEYADAVGADGYAADAAGATKRAKELLAERRCSSGRRPILRADRALDRWTTIPSCGQRPETVVIGPDQPFCIIGERINPTGRKAFAEAAPRRRPLAGRRRRRGAGGGGRRTCSTSTWACRSRTRPSCSRRAVTARPGAHRPAALHRLVRRRGARGRARRLRGQGARQLGDLRGRAARARCCRS